MHNGGERALTALLVAGAVACWPDLFDAGVFKTAVLALLAGCLLVPMLAWRARGACAAWFSSTGARLHLLSILMAVPAALAVLHRAAVVDRILLLAVVHVAAVLGLQSARRGRDLAAPVLLATSITAAVAWLQAMGWERNFTPGPDEIVALMGNSTRAGALLALGIVAAAGALATEESARQRRLLGAGLAAATMGLALTSALAGLIGAAAGLCCVVGRAPVRRRTVAAIGVPLLAGVLMAWATVGPGVFTGEKRAPEQGPRWGRLLAGTDTTLQVRGALWSASLAMARDEPWTGHGLGRFRERFPPYRHAGEAALPGLAGAPTHASHPHNELLLSLVEGGWIGGTLLAAFFLATLARAWRRAGSETGPGVSVALGLVVTGGVTALAQDGWTFAGTAVPYFAAVGWTWAPAFSGHTSARPTLTRTVAVPAAVCMGVALVLLALPRARCAWTLSRFPGQRDAHGITAQSFGTLVKASEADPTDVDAQQILAAYGQRVLEAVPEARDDIRLAIERARHRLQVLAPHEH